MAGLTDNAIGQAQGSVVDFIGLGPFTGERWLVAHRRFARRAGTIVSIRFDGVEIP